MPEGLTDEQRRETGRRRWCQKHRYPTRVDAIFAMCDIQHRHGGERERRAYECPRCHGWHLTSKPYRTATADQHRVTDTEENP